MSFLPMAVCLHRIGREGKLSKRGLPLSVSLSEGHPDASHCNCRVAWANDDQVGCEPIAGINYTTTILYKQA